MWWRFTDADRETLGLDDEWVELDLSHVTLGEAAALEEAGGAWAKLADTGADALRMRTWLALHRAGVKRNVDELDSIDVGGLRVREGKDEATSPPDASNTRPTSRSSRPSRRRTSPTST